MELTQFVEDVKLLAHLSEEERSKVGPRRRRRRGSGIAQCGADPEGAGG